MFKPTTESYRRDFLRYCQNSHKTNQHAVSSLHKALLEYLC